MKAYVPLIVFLWAQVNLYAAGLAVKGLSIQAPDRHELEPFLRFIEEELVPREINTLVLRVDYRYQYRSHPELVGENALSREEARRLSAHCRRYGIRLIPQINLLGHQSWHSRPGNLLRVYPEFDETPDIDLPETYAWPNEDGLYCKSYCPLHPEVHDVVFALVDEILGALEADTFHAGMDEVFYIGHEQCPRCRGKDKAVLFANEVKRIHAHLDRQGKELWIWGDRLLNGETTGLGMWEASMNGTHPAIDLIPKDVVICDWHYERAEPTAVYFAMKGFRVVTCAWNKPEVAVAQAEQMLAFKEKSNPVLSSRYLGVMHTVWSPAKSFMRSLQDRGGSEENQKDQADCFNALFKKPAE